MYFAKDSFIIFESAYVRSFQIFHCFAKWVLNSFYTRISALSFFFFISSFFLSLMVFCISVHIMMSWWFFDETRSWTSKSVHHVLLARSKMTFLSRLPFPCCPSYLFCLYVHNWMLKNNWGQPSKRQGNSLFEEFGWRTVLFLYS